LVAHEEFLGLKGAYFQDKDS